MSFERGKHRRKHVPKAGPLYVNGIKTPKGNVHQAAKRVTDKMNRSKAYGPGELAEVILVKITNTARRCDWCLEQFDYGETAAYEPSLDAAWHLRSRGGHTCRSSHLRAEMT